jgi:ABC-type multidrug transport system fused ATPase/permease subunit
MRSVKSREKKLQDRMGLEKSAKGTRFKLNRDLEGYHLTSRAEVVVDRAEMELSWKIPPPPEIRSGVLVSLEDVSVGYGLRPGAGGGGGGKIVLEGVSLSVFPGSRLSVVGSVSEMAVNLQQS